MILRFLPILLLASGEHIAANFFVAPDGSPSGDGTLDSPWDLQTALSHPRIVAAGDHIWLRGGVYTGPFTSKLAGTPGLPIIVRNYKNERAILDFPGEPEQPAVLHINGEWTWYWGLEITSSWEPRIDPPKNRANAVAVYGPNVKLINMIMHDTFGAGFWSGSDDSEMYGNIIYNTGNDGSQRGHGHGIYAQNRDGTKRLTDNIIFQSFSHGIHVYGSGNAHLNNFRLEGNVVFDNGVLSRFGEERNILLGGAVVAQQPVLISNFTYWSKAASVGQNNIGYLAGCDQLIAKNNYFAVGAVLTLVKCEPELLEGNTFIGAVSGFDQAKYPSNAYYPFGSKPSSGVDIFVRPNRFEKGRGHIIVYNWDHKPETDVDLSDILTPGQPYEIRDAQNYWGEPVVKGTYDGASVSVPMKLHAVSPIVGSVPTPPVHTSEEFGVFVVRAVSQESEPNANSPSQAGAN
ncbi:MAG: right-handed parallel beta-helix repeat-containing protein [Bryobacterales bacterium]|nr:right-handed parallel beta-helix repeat-containing protein [Bryobacterales bacterium]